MAQTEYRPDVIPQYEVFELEDIATRRRRYFYQLLHKIIPKRYLTINTLTQSQPIILRPINDFRMG